MLSEILEKRQGALFRSTRVCLSQSHVEQDVQDLLGLTVLLILEERV